MSIPAKFQCNIDWPELLSSNEIRDWVLNQKMPKNLHGRMKYSGVYRFVFNEFKDENGKHIPCYVGESGNIGRRLSDHFRHDDKERRDKEGELVVSSGSDIKGGIRNSLGDFALQHLRIKGPVTFCGLTFGPDTIPDPLMDSFTRKMLENWAILYSEYVDLYHPINRRGTPHIFKDMLKNARKRSKKNATQK